MSAPFPLPFAELHRALIVKLRHHGDVLLASPVFTALKRLAPQCELDALVYADTAPLLQHHPAIARVHTIDRSWKRLGAWPQARAETRLFAALRARHYDLIVVLGPHWRGAWLSRLLKPRFSVAPRLPSRFWQASFTHLYPRASHPQRHTVESHLDALRRLGLIVDPADKPLVLRPGAAAEARVASLLAERGLSAGRFIHLHPASRWRFKCWPVEKFAALAGALAAQGWPLVFTAAPEAGERQMVAEIIVASAVPSGLTPASSMRGHAFNLAGQLDLPELAALTAQARLFVGVDSAPMHIAAAMGTPVVALFGPSGDIEWAPWQVTHRVVVSAQHPCRPCGLDGCGGGKLAECLSELPVAEVLTACRVLLSEGARCFNPRSCRAQASLEEISPLPKPLSP